MKKQINMLIMISIVFIAMFAAVQTVYADDGPEGCIAFTSDNEFTVSLCNDHSQGSWDGTIEVSTDGTVWDKYRGNGEITAALGNGKYSVFFRGINNSIISGGSSSTRFRLSGSDSVSCSGNIENLLDYATVQNGGNPIMKDGAFFSLFRDCTSLIKAPDLPATTLSKYCYYSMFLGCTSLKAAPALPATEMKEQCYFHMFDGCTNLTSAPELPAETVTGHCYDAMFKFCSSLENAPDLPAKKLNTGCYIYMFSGCTSLKAAPKLPATTLSPFCYYAMFYNCKSLTLPPELPATTLASKCYTEMFSGSGVMISDTGGTFNDIHYGFPYRIPRRGEGTVSEESLNGMFDNTQGEFTGTPEINQTYFLPAPGWSGSGTETDPIVISDAIGWKTLKEYIDMGYSMDGLFFKLGDNIEVTDMVGASGKPFSGSFDGAGYTLTFNAENAPRYCAPFAYAKDAVFRNLHIAGTIKTKQQFAAGLIGRFDGTVKVTNCRSSIIIDSGLKMVNGEPSNGIHGGFIAVGKKDGAAEFEGCVFDGMLLGPATKNCGGFLGGANTTDKVYSFMDCVFAPQELTIRSDLFNFIGIAPASTTISNSYYMKSIDDDDQGEAARAVTADKGIRVGKPKNEYNEYNVSNITAFETGLAYGDIFYAGKDEKIPVIIPSIHVSISASAGTLVGKGTAYILTMPNKDVHLTLSSLNDTPIDDRIPVVKTAKIFTKGNFKKKQMKIIFPASRKVDKYRIQYRMAGKKKWKSDWSSGVNTYVISGMKKYSLCEFRIAGFVKQTDGSWVRGKWSKISYRYMYSVPLKAVKAGRKRITVTWKKDKKASGYQVWYSPKKDMTGDKCITVNGKSKTKCTIKGLKKGKKYYVRVRPVRKKYGKKYLGILTGVKAAKVK